MLISCKCLNFIATSNSSQQQQPQKTSNAAVAPAVAAAGATSPSPVPQSDVWREHAPAPSNGLCGSSEAASLMNVFLQKYPRNFVFYVQCMDFFKQAIGPIPDLTINAVNQRDLIYSLTLELAQARQTPGSSWQISVCINCNTPLCAKQLTQPSAVVAAPANNPPPQFLVNCSLLTNNEELAQRRADNSYSETFGLLIMDQPRATFQDTQGGFAAPSRDSLSFSIGSMSSSFSMAPTHDPKQQRLRQLQLNLQQRLKREIAETDERIHRYTEQQFALLKSFREKSEQEYDQLVDLVQRVPETAEQQEHAWLDRVPPALDVNAAASFASRRRNTIGSRRDVNSGSAASAMVPTTPTTPNPPVNMLALPAASAIETPNTAQTGGALATPFFANGRIGSTAVITASVAGSRKMSNFDTPPVTPEATPMSVGNSPTFRQQQQQQQQLPPQPFSRFVTVAAAASTASNQASFQQQFPTPTAESADECLFELEGVEDAYPPAVVPNFNLNHPLARFHQQYQTQQQQQQQQHQLHFQRSMSHQQANNMSDVLYESDNAEEAEDALDLESSMPIPMRNSAAADREDVFSFARSLPIAIANSPMAAGRAAYMGESDEDDVDNNRVDIAASIQALAKSVHGEAVFGDLPRPRLRSQI